MQLPTITPRLYQLPVWSAFQNNTTRIVKSWPRRAGKDLSDFSMMVSRAIKHAGVYYYMFPTRAWATRALWDNMPEWTGGRRLIDVICPPEIVAGKNNSDYFIDLKNGSRITIEGTDAMNFLGQGGSMYVLSEFQNHKPEVTGFLSPILTESDAPVIFNGTLRGKNNQMWQFYDNNKGRNGWFTQWYTLEHTKTNYWINPDEGLYINPELAGLISPYTGKPFKNIQDEVDSGMTSMAKARQEYMNELVSQVENAYYTREINLMEGEGRLNLEFDGQDKVYTFWDLGGVQADSDTTAITFATYNKFSRKVQIVDYYEGKGHLRGHYLDVISTKNYDYGGHFLPHDGKRRNVFTGEGMAETARRLHGIEMRYVPKANSVQNEIEITRRLFANTSIDGDKCSDLVDHLSKYHESETTGKECHRNNCAICRGASHGADTVRLLAMAIEHGIVNDYIGSGGSYTIKSTPEFLDMGVVV